MTVESYLHQGRRLFARWAGDQGLRQALRVAAHALAGLVLSAAGIGGFPQPFAMALVGVMTGWRAVVTGLGSICGYLLFWGGEGQQGVAWVCLSCLTALVLGDRPILREAPLLLSAGSALWVAAVGLVCQIAGHSTPTLLYFLRVALAWGAARLFQKLKAQREPPLTWCAQAIAVLGLAGMGPAGLNFGALAVGAMAPGAAFPAAVLGGLALDLSGISHVPMTAVAAAVCAARMMTGIPGWLLRLAPGALYLGAAVFSGIRSPVLAAPLLLGGLLSVFLPSRAGEELHRGDMGLVQLRLELMAQALHRTRLLALEAEEPPIDEEALLVRTRERACGSCPNRRTCAGPGTIPRELLHRPLTENTGLPFFCRKPGRMVLELRRTQEQLRLLQADRQRRQEYRGAVGQQYLFLGEYLREQAEKLSRRGEKYHLRFQTEVAWAARSREPENGDRFRHFSGPGGRYYLLLCDGMGTGLGAAGEGESAAGILEGMLTAGFPPEYALESLNSLLALRGRAGAVTVDLAELRLDTGAAVLYKWGAAPSVLLRGGSTEKLGTATPPPGIRVADVREKQERLSLRRGEILVLLSDGVDGEGVRRRAVTETETPLGELAANLLEAGAEDEADDATVAVARLHRSGMLT